MPCLQDATRCAVGVRGVFFPNRGSHGLEPRHFTIAELLKSAGYKTLAAGKWHLGDEPKFLPTNQGFDTFYGVPYSNDMYPAENEICQGLPLPRRHVTGDNQKSLCRCQTRTPTQAQGQGSPDA